MGSKGRLPPPHHLRRPLPGPAIGHHDQIPPEMHHHHHHNHHHGGYPPYDMPPHPEIMEQKLAAQHIEMQKLATENQRFAATHGTLRQDVAAIQHELQMLNNHVGTVKSEREQQIMGLLDKNAKMEADLKGAEAIKMELNKARVDAQSLVKARDELVSRVQKLTDDHQRAHMDLQQVPVLMSELESLRQEYHHSRATYEYEKKLYNEHLESLQVMEKNYMNMAAEVEKLRAELKKHAENDKKMAAATATAAPYTGFAGHNDKEPSGHYPVTQNAYDDPYAAPQGRAPLPVGGAAADATAVGGGYDIYRGTGYYQQGPVAPPTYDPQWGPTVQPPPAYDPQRVPGAPVYDPQRGVNAPGYDMYRGGGGSAYDWHRVPGGPARGPQFGGPGYESPTVPTGPPGTAMQQVSNAGYVQPPPASADGNHPGRR